VAAVVYVTALVPLDGEAMADLPQREPSDPVNLLLVRDDARGIMSFDRRGAATTLYNECDPSTAAWATARLEPESVAATRGRARFAGGRFPAIPRTYVECGHDRTITPARQELIRERAGCEAVVHLAADHSPFLSRPEALAQILLGVATGD